MDRALLHTERLLRLILPASAALGLCGFIYALWQLQPSRMGLAAVAVIVVQAYVVAELCRVVLDRFERHAGGAGDARRLAFQLALSLAVATAYSLAIYVPFKLWLIDQGERDAIGPAHLTIIILPALAISLLVGLAHFTLRFLRRWRRSAEEAERHRREALRAELEALQAQVNPHFLFNSINVVYGLIPEDRAQAQALLLRLSEVFRYALRHGSAATVCLRDELDFAEAYAALLRARHGAALSISLERRDDEARFHVPPLSLQTLIENAIKHTAFDVTCPLDVVVRRDVDAVVVENPLRPRMAGGSPGTGLGSIERRYALLGGRRLHVSSGAGRFRVSLPLLEAP